MAHSITIKLNKPANIFQAGESTGFSIRGGVQYYDHKTKQKEWTNYSAVIFARQPGQIDFYTSALVEGAIVEVMGKNQKIDIYEGGQNGASYTIELLEASLGYIGFAGSAAPQQAAQQGGGWGQPSQPQQQAAPQQQQQPQYQPQQPAQPQYQQAPQQPNQYQQASGGYQQPQQPQGVNQEDDIPF